MSMLTFFPSLKPAISSSICFDVDQPCDDESELREMEKEHVEWLKSIQMTAIDVPPFGKNPTVAGVDQDTDDEVNNDDSEDSDSHDEEEDEVEATDTNPGVNGNNTIASDIASLE